MRRGDDGMRRWAAGGRGTEWRENETRSDTGTKGEAEAGRDTERKTNVRRSDEKTQCGATEESGVNRLADGARMERKMCHEATGGRNVNWRADEAQSGAGERRELVFFCGANEERFFRSKPRVFIRRSCADLRSGLHALCRAEERRSAERRSVALQ